MRCASLIAPPCPAPERTWKTDRPLTPNFLMSLCVCQPNIHQAKAAMEPWNLPFRTTRSNINNIWLKKSAQAQDKTSPPRSRATARFRIPDERSRPINHEHKRTILPLGFLGTQPQTSLTITPVLFSHCADWAR